MKIVTPKEMIAADQASQSLGIPSRVLMESAGREVVAFMLSQFPRSIEQGVVLLCGRGNNGGDGYVVARILASYGFPVEVVASEKPEMLRGDARENALLFLRLGGSVHELQTVDVDKVFEHCGIVIDALYGTGFGGQLKDNEARIVEYVNAFAIHYHVPVIAIDIASGVDGETGHVSSPSIRADATIALQCLKVGHLALPGAENCGDVFVADIGIPQSLKCLANIDRELITEEHVAELLQEKFVLPANAHKGTRGKVLVIGGSPGYFGAAKLAGEAALLSGAGLVSLVLPRSVTLSTDFEELICQFLPDDGQGNFVEGGFQELPAMLSSWDSIVLGPGLSQRDGAKKLVFEVLRIGKELGSRIVIDADALNILAEASPAEKKLISEHCILTPHPGEMARLGKTTVENVESARISSAMSLSSALGGVVVLKGARTVVADRAGSVSISPTATPVLATAGSGDVLSGLLGTLLARGFSPFEAAEAGVFVHGAAGELLQEEHPGGIGVKAGDIMHTIPKVLHELLKMESFEKQFLSKALSKLH